MACPLLHCYLFSNHGLINQILHAASLASLLYHIYFLNYVYLYLDTSLSVKWLNALSSTVPFGLGLTEVCPLRPLTNLYRLFGV